MSNALNEREAARLTEIAAREAASNAQRDSRSRVNRRRRAKERRLIDRLSRGFIRIRSTDPDITVTVRLGEGGADLTGGFGGWAEVQRPRRIAFTEWQGLSPYRMSVPVLFDGFADGMSVEEDIRKLERMAIPARKGFPPPTLRIDGAVPKTDLTWVVESLDFGDSIRDQNGKGFLDRVRQAITINLLHYESPEGSIIVKGAASIRQERGKKRSSRPYTVKRDDSLTRIAARKLGSAKRWKEIAELNNIRDPDKITIGQRLKMP